MDGTPHRSAPAPSTLAGLLGVAVFVVLWVRDWGDLLTHIRPTQTLLGADYDIYIGAARRFLAGGGYVLPAQLAGPYTVAIDPVLYPPEALTLFIPFTVLPMALWWIVPIAVLVTVTLWHRPAAWFGRSSPSRLGGP